MSHDDTYDDDRLLAYALGLDDDPELEAAAEADPVLRGRLEAMRADVGAVAASLERVVPHPPDDYADLGQEHWSELRDLVTAPVPAAPRRRRSWLRVLAPAAAVALVLVAGVVGLQRLSAGDAGQEMTAGSADKAPESYGAGRVGEPADDGALVPSLGRGAPDPADWATIVVARAQKAVGGRQRFLLERVLRGKTPEGAAGEYLTLTVVDEAVPPSALTILYLDPLRPPSPAGGGGTTATLAPSQRDMEAAVIAYEYDAAAALAQQLPSGTDPDAVTLP